MNIPDHLWVAGLLVGIGGISLGIGLMIGVFVIRLLRRYMHSDDVKERNGKSDI